MCIRDSGGILVYDVGVGKTFTALAAIGAARQEGWVRRPVAVSYTHLRAHETVLDLVCRLLLEKKQLHTSNLQHTP